MTIDISLEELTQEQIKDMTREMAQELWNERNILQGKIRHEMDLLRDKIWPDRKILDTDEIQRIKFETPVLRKCPHCGGNDLMPQKGKRFFCRTCNVSSEVA
jgi:ribosomal protein S27AE